MGEGEFRSSCASASRARPAPTRPSFLIRPNAGPAVRARRRDGVGRRALARSRSRSRRSPAARRWSSTRSTPASAARPRTRVARDAARGSPSARRCHDHAPAADRERRRPALPRREGARRPDAHADRASSPTTSGATSSSGCSAARSSSPTRRDDEHRSSSSPGRPGSTGARSTSSSRLGAGRHRDHRPHRPRPRLRRGAARVRRARRRQRRRLADRPLPEPGPAAARPRRRPADRRPGRAALRRGRRRRAAHRPRRERLPQRHLPRERARARRERELERALAEQQGRVTEALEAFAENTMRYLREEGSLLAEGIDFPPLETRFRDRHALVVARGPGYKRDLRIVRPYIRDFKPVLVAVDGGADALLEAGLQAGRDRRRHGLGLRRRAPRRRRARRPRLPRTATRPARARLERLGLPYQAVPAPGISEDVALLLALREGRRADRRRRHALQPDRVPRARTAPGCRRRS